MLTSLKCPMCREAAVTLADTGEWLCIDCGACGRASSESGRILWQRDRRSVLMKKPPAKAETIAPPPAS